MSMRYQAGILTASYFPLKVPDAPTGATATQASSTSVSVAFTAPSNVGGGAITSYTVVSSGGDIATGASSPITVTGLTTGVAYTFVVYANNAFGNSPASASSNSVTPAAVGQQAYTTPGTYSWVAPAGVTSVSVLCIGGGAGGNKTAPTGAGGGAGGLGYKNNYTVTPGNSYTVVVGAGGVGSGTYSGTYTGQDGEDSYFISTAVVMGGKGRSPSNGRTGGTYVGDGGGNGGAGGVAGSYCGGGGGTAGYSGNGGAGGSGGGSAGSNGSGGGSGGGAAGGNLGGGGYAGSGGGTGLLGQGANGAGGSTVSSAGDNGFGGSGGINGNGFGANNTATGSGGGGGSDFRPAAAGGPGAVRIIWGAGRAFPSTNTGNL